MTEEPASGDPTDATEQEHQHLVDSSLPAMFEAYDDAKAEGIASPAVLLVDCLDPFGAAIARSLVGDEMVQEAIAEHSAEGEEASPVFAAAMGWDECRERSLEGFPYLEEAFEAGPPEDGFLAISVTAGGAAAFTAPFDARPA